MAYEEDEKQEEKWQPVTEVREELRRYSRAMSKLRIRAREVLHKPFCEACARLDYQKTGVKDVEAYTGAELLKEDKVRDRKTHKIIGIMRDYRCSRGHGISMEVSNEELSEWEAEDMKEKTEKKGE